MVEIEFVHVPEGRTVVYGPYEFVQVTYGLVRASHGGDDEEEVAFFRAGYWTTLGFKREVWTDFIVRTRR